MLKSEGRVVRPIAIRPEGDKESRVSGASHRIENGEVSFLRDAPWRADLEREMLGFPSAEHDDLVDALAQLIKWATPTKRLPRKPGRPRLFDEGGEVIYDDQGRRIPDPDFRYGQD